MQRDLTETTQHSSLSHQSRGDDNYQNRTKNKTWPEIAIELCTWREATIFKYLGHEVRKDKIISQQEKMRCILKIIIPYQLNIWTFTCTYGHYTSCHWDTQTYQDMFLTPPSLVMDTNNTMHFRLLSMSCEWEDLLKYKCVLDRLALSYSHASNPTKPKLRVRLFKSLTNLTALWLFFCAKAWEHWL